LFGVEALRVEAANKTPGGCAPGYRYAYSGEPVYVGYGGFSWAAAASGINGLDLHFGVTWLGPSGAHYRAYGFQLRCLLE